MQVLLATRYRIAPKARLVFDRARGKHMLIYPERGLALNELGREVLALCDGEHSVARVIELVAARFVEVERATVARDVTEFLEQLAARGLLRGEE